jgi:ssDNA-binding replication factor A large subunit
MADEAIEKAVKEVLSQIPDADEDMVREEFVRYHKEFVIPPQDAMRSVLRKVQSNAGIVAATTEQSAGGIQAAPLKKVERLAELGPEDKNIVIEVKIITHNPVTQAVRGRDRDIAFGTLEDNPWGNDDKVRWDYKDWAPSPNLKPGAIVRIEGCSVNEYQGKRSLNINQSSRVIVLQEGAETVIDPTEPMTIAEAIQAEGMVTIVGRVISSRDDVITKRDGSGTIDVVRGKIADDTGSLGFLSWEPFTHQTGVLLKIQSATIRRFRDTPELNFGRTTKVEIFHDSNFADAETLAESSVVTISQLRDGAKDVTIIAQLQSLTERKFTNAEGEEKIVYAGQLIDPTGQCKSSMWCDVGITEDELPIVVRLENARVRAWQGIPDVTIDDVNQVIRLEQKPWDDINVENHVIEAKLSELAKSGSRVGISTAATVVSVRDDCGIIWRCPECRRTLRDDNCQVHGSVTGTRDVRMRMVIDDGQASGSVIIGNEPTLEFLDTDMSGFEDMLAEKGQFGFAQSLRNSLLGRQLKVNGRTIVDEQGMMIIANDIEVIEVDAVLAASESRDKWGLL